MAISAILVWTKSTGVKVAAGNATKRQIEDFLHSEPAASDGVPKTRKIGVVLKLPPMKDLLASGSWVESPHRRQVWSASHSDVTTTIEVFWTRPEWDHVVVHVEWNNERGALVGVLRKVGAQFEWAGAGVAVIQQPDAKRPLVLKGAKLDPRAYMYAVMKPGDAEQELTISTQRRGNEVEFLPFEGPWPSRLLIYGSPTHREAIKVKLPRP